MKQKKTPRTRMSKTSKTPSMTELMEYLNKQNGRIHKRDLARKFGVKGDDRVALRGMIKDLKRSGKIQTGPGGRTVSVVGSLPDRVVVEITGVDSMGDLVARPLEWTVDAPMPQIVITRDKLSPPAGVGDVIQASVKSTGSRMYEGTSLRRVTAGDNHMVGVYENGEVFSVDRRMKQSFAVRNVPHSVKLQNRDVVIIDIPMIRTRDPVATFVKKIGSMNDAFSATLIAIYLHNLPVAFTEATEAEVQKVTVPRISKGRVDLRHIRFVTIDGADARDFDDAVWAEPDLDPTNKGGWHLMVGIADVSWYVRHGSALDADARLRGNSTYFPDRVLPMLPFELSAGVCSLKPDEPRAAMVCEVWINKDGHKIRHVFKRALIQSVRRLTYPQVQDALDGTQKIEGLENEIAHLHHVYKSLLKRRARRGVLEIDMPERQIVLNDKGLVTSIQSRVQLDSMKLIEEMMILSNVAAAETLEDAGLPTMYRVHDRPSVEKVERLNAFLQSLGRHGVRENAEPRDFNTILTRSDGTSQDFAVNEFVLRSQSQAIYSPDNIGHFGLALQRYAHFTSPIRRYADVMVHRALVTALKLGEGGLTDAEVEEFDNLAQHISGTERQSSDAERDAVDRYVTSFLVDKVGAQFTARISSVTSFGMFVRLDEYGADGFVPFRVLTGDFYEYDERAQSLVGRSTGRTFTVGDMVQVLLREADPQTGSMMFSIVSKKSVKKSEKKRRK